MGSKRVFGVKLKLKIMPELQVKSGQYYYHFKHDPSKGISDQAYLIIGTGVHTETEEVFVIYKSLYFIQGRRIDKYGADFNVRPIAMFLEQNFEKDGKIILKRFTKIIDENILEELKNLVL